MRLSYHDLLKEFFQEYARGVKPGLTISKLEEAVSFPWKQAKETLSKGNLPLINFRFFGKFRVFPGRARYMLKKTEERYRKGIISKQKYEFVRDSISRYLRENFGEEEK